MSNYIFVTGGVVSGVGKCVTTASLGRLLIERGLRVTLRKFDPYENLEKGNINPLQFGEVFVTADGHEDSLTLGKYERFLDIDLNKNSCYTTGEITNRVIEKNNRGEFSASVIQQVPHITSEIKKILREADNEKTDIVLVDIGGTVGDMETGVYLEAIRQFEREIKDENYIHIHITYAPYLNCSGDVKTKPTQHSIKEVMSYGLNPDVIICRTEKNVEFNEQKRKKLAMYCNLLDSNHVIHIPDCQSIYEVPIVMANEKLDILTCSKLGVEVSKLNLSIWQEMVDTMYEDLPIINIAIVGKYTEITNSYISVSEAVRHASFKNKYRAKITIISSEDLEVVGAKDMLKDYDGVIVGGGFGKSGINGKIMTAEYCRENKIPYLGLSLGMEVAVIEFARNVANLKDAHSTEFNENTQYPVIHKGNGEIRLGNYNVNFVEGTLARRLYGRPHMQERHRNAYEFNNEYKETFEKLGMVFSGFNDDNSLVETIEYIDHPFFMGTIYQPEFTSRPYRPHPIFVGFITGVISSFRKPKI